jgi:hypothetical protein
MSVNSANPLAKHFRQPAIYLRLPSLGKFWPENTIDLPLNNEIPVYPMTAKDEIVLRTPDALINGQAIIDIIQSCCPNVKDAWKMPSIDVDAILIAIRIASYGSQLDVDITCPHCQHEQTLGVDLSYMIDGVRVPDYSNKLEFEDIKIKLHPQPYFSVNHANTIRYEEQRIISALLDSDMPEQEKMVEYSSHLSKIVELNLDILVNSTEYIEINDGTIVSNIEHIKEYFLNCDAEVVHQLQSALEELAKSAGMPLLENNCTNCEKSYSIPMEFDYANFFVRKS